MRGALVGLLLAAVIVACARPMMPPPVDKRQEILTLWTQIRQWRHEHQWDLEPPSSLIQYTRNETVRDARNVCPDGTRVPTTCGDVCTLGEDICDNAERICTLADELGKDDQFAQEKCTSAKASCREGKQRCCDCVKNPPAAAAGATPGRHCGAWRSAWRAALRARPRPRAGAGRA